VQEYQDPLQLRATRDGRRDAGRILQFVRSSAGSTAHPRANQAAFDRAVEDVAAAARVLIGS